MGDAQSGAFVSRQVRHVLEPVLVHLLCGLRRLQVEEAVRLLLDYIDAQPMAAACSEHPQAMLQASPADRAAKMQHADSQAMEMFRTFVRDNAPALRMVAHWGDGECGSLHEVLKEELQGGRAPLANRCAADGEQMADGCPTDGNQMAFAMEQRP